DSMRPSAPKRHCALVEQPPKSLARGDHASRGPTAANPFSKAARKGRDSAHSLHDVEAHALQRQQIVPLPFQPQQRFPALENIAILFHGAHRNAKRLKPKPQFCNSSGHTRLSRHYDRRTRLALDSERLSRSILGPEIDPQKRIGECADLPRVIAILQGKPTTPKQRFLELLRPYGSRVHPF